MLKWVRERLRVLALHRDGAAVVGPKIVNHPAVSAVTLAVPRHVTAISTALLTTPNTRQSTVMRARFSGGSMATQRRPGVHARWKEKNRLPMQGSV